MAAAKRRELPLILRNNERHFTLSDLARILPEKPSYELLWSWCTRGIDNIDGERIFLEFVWGLQSRRCRRSSVEAYNRFVKRKQGYYE